MTLDSPAEAENSQLLQTGVAVEKLDLSKLVENTLRQEALQATFSIFLDIFYP